MQMYNKHKVIKPEELEVGMKAAYPYNVAVGWYRNFRYPRWVGGFVKRVTPKRTKAVLECKNGNTIEVDLKKEHLYELDADMEHEVECVLMYKDCERLVSSYSDGKWKTLSSLSDAELKEVHTLLTALDKLMKKEK